MNKQNSYTSSSRKAIIRVLLKFVVFVVVLNVIFLTLLTPAYDDCYNASILDKMNRLKSIDGPKIILVGNSNVSYGFRSEIIEQEMNMPVVNLGLHASLGNAVHENMIKGYVGEGDIVVVSHFNFYDDAKIANPAVAWITIENHFSLWNIIPTSQWPAMVMAYPTYVKKCINRKLFNRNDEYEERKYFNKYGDYIYADYNDVHYEFTDDFVSLPPNIQQSSIDRLNELNEYVESKGATLLIAGYPIAYKEDDEGFDERFGAYENEIKKQLNATYISSYEDYKYPYEDFCNSAVHLRTDAAKRRSMQLVEDMERHFANSN